MSKPLDPEIRLADYQPPAWRVERVSLDFELGRDETLVRSNLWLQRDPARRGVALRLDGEELETLEVELDGRLLEADEYRIDDDGLYVPSAPSRCELRTLVRIRPAQNTRLEGLYCSGEMLLTQCEAEGFRRITWFPDRPDVSAVYEVCLRAPRADYPVLLANGDLVASGQLSGGWHFARWRDPHPKPSYLFALVAGRLERLRAPFTTMHGRTVQVSVWAAPGDVERCQFALDAVLRAMRWDEQRFGRAYDLDVFNVVAAQDFTMGAMENKGLNIFNARYVLADADTATDDDHLAIESVIGHEYFHNWSGNRVTLRDWFQLSLKEGLTVFRDQEFTSDLNSRALKRIEDVRVLRTHQFVEDAGPLAHPVRPPSYREINNFYTATVYEKGAELIRMLHRLLGEEDFRAGLDLYFERHDGAAATVEDLLAALAEASGRDLEQFLRWWAQPGTPRLEIRDQFDAGTGNYELRIVQHNAAADEPLHIPLALALYDAQGQRIEHPPWTPGAAEAGLLELREREHVVRLEGLAAQPLPAFLHGFSAPVQIDYPYGIEQLVRLVQVESDPLVRWGAIRQLGSEAVLPGPRQAVARQALLAAQEALLQDADEDPAFVAECLRLPEPWDLASGLESIDPGALWSAREAVLDELAHAQQPLLQQRKQDLERLVANDTADGAAARRLYALCLDRLARATDDPAPALEVFDRTSGLTLRLAALRTLVHRGLPGADRALRGFADRHAGDPLMTDRWLGVLASAPRADVVDLVRALLKGPHWRPTNPNRVRAVLATFAYRNLPAFHRADGAGYALLFGQLPGLDRINPQIASRLLGLLESWRRLEPQRRGLVEGHLRGLAAGLVSRDSRETLARLLKAPPGGAPEPGAE